MDPVFLARLQFGLTIAFHYIFPPLSIGLGLILIIMEATYLRTRDRFYLDMTRFWVKIFALIFSIGVATGIVMEFQFGTNWAGYSRYVGDVFGSALAAEGVFAFFLESGFLALLIFGWDRVGAKTHFFATLMVAMGAMFSAVWIVVADSWMQTPAGFHIVSSPSGPRAEVTEFWKVVFNPSAMDRLWHVLMGAWQAGAWLVISVAAYYLLKGRHERFSKVSMKIGLTVALLASLLQLLSGHHSALVAAEHQPAKMAAFEGHYPASAPANLYLVGWVHESDRTVIGIRIPGMLSWMIHGRTDAPVKGLDAFGQDIPPVNVVFQTYHAMVGIGMILIALSLAGAWLAFRGTLWSHRRLLWIFVLAVLLPQAANQLGWFSAEVGRQPWIVYSLMRTADGISRTVSAGQILGSVLMFGFMYLLLFVLFIYLLDQKIRHGPDTDDHAHAPPRPLHGDRAAL